MDPALYRAVLLNDIHAFISLVRKNEAILDQRTSTASNTVLHLASRLGFVDLVMEIIKLRPNMVQAENKMLETPLHEACREGKSKIVLLLLQTGSWVASNFNMENQSPLLIACSNGHLEVVKVLLNQPLFLRLEYDNPHGLTSLHVAASKGHTGMCLFRLSIDKHIYLLTRLITSTLKLVGYCLSFFFFFFFSFYTDKLYHVQFM